jgi:hypothetical protein
MLQCVIYEICLVRNIGEIESTISLQHGVPSEWDRTDVLDWIGYKFGDLIDAGWTCNLERVDHGNH